MTADGELTAKGGGTGECPLERAVGHRTEFFGALEANLKDLRPDYCFPSVWLPWMARLVPWQQRVRKVEAEDDLTPLWAHVLKRSGLVADEEQARRCNGFRTYELRRGGIRFRVAAVFATAPGGEGKIGGGHLACAAQTLREYEEGTARYRPASASILVVGTDGTFSEDAKPMVTEAGLCLLASKPQASAHWRLAWPVVPSDVVWHSFLAHLSPLGAEELRQLIADASRRLQTLMHLASAKRLAEDLALPLPLVEWEMGQMVKTGEFCLVNGELLKATGGAWRRWLLIIRDAMVFSLYVKICMFLVAMGVGALCLLFGKPADGLWGMGVTALCETCVSRFLRRVWQVWRS